MWSMSLICANARVTNGSGRVAAIGSSRVACVALARSRPVTAGRPRAFQCESNSATDCASAESNCDCRSARPLRTDACVVHQARTPSGTITPPRSSARSRARSDRNAGFRGGACPRSAESMLSQQAVETRARHAQDLCRLRLLVARRCEHPRMWSRSAASSDDSDSVFSPCVPSTTCSGRMTPPRAATTARVRPCSSSRTFPGQSYP